MITLIWRHSVYVMVGDYYSVREALGVPDEDITPWAPLSQGLDWTEEFTR